VGTYFHASLSAWVIAVFRPSSNIVQVEQSQKFVADSYSITKEEVATTIKDMYKNHQYILDPHTAIGVAAANKYTSTSLYKHNPIVCCATATPAKFV